MMFFHQFRCKHLIFTKLSLYSYDKFFYIKNIIINWKLQRNRVSRILTVSGMFKCVWTCTHGNFRKLHNNCSLKYVSFERAVIYTFSEWKEIDTVMGLWNIVTFFSTISIWTEIEIWKRFSKENDLLHEHSQKINSILQIL